MPSPVGCRPAGRPQSSIRLFHLSLLNNQTRSTLLFDSHNLQIVFAFQFRQHSNPKRCPSTPIYTTLPANPHQCLGNRSIYNSRFFPTSHTPFAFAIGRTYVSAAIIYRLASSFLLRFARSSIYWRRNGNLKGRCFRLFNIFSLCKCFYQWLWIIGHGIGQSLTWSWHETSISLRFGVITVRRSSHYER